MRDLFSFLIQQPLLLLAMAAIFVSVLGGMVLKAVPWLGRVLRGAGTLGLVAALLLTVAQAARMSGSSDAALIWAGLRKQEVSGGATRIPLSADGHYWVTAEINGQDVRFMIDTGATLTAISPATARAAGIEPGSLDRTIVLRTANGEVSARTGSIATLRFGNIVARDLETVIVPAAGETNVIGMNLLSRLASWKAEDQVLILQPKNPQLEAQQGSY